MYNQKSIQLTPKKFPSRFFAFISIFILVAGMLAGCTAPSTRIPGTKGDRATDINEYILLDQADRAQFEIDNVLASQAELTSSSWYETTRLLIQSGNLSYAEKLLQRLRPGNRVDELRYQTLKAALANTQFDPESALGYLNFIDDSLPPEWKEYSTEQRAIAFELNEQYLSATKERILLDNLLRNPARINNNRLKIWQLLNHYHPFALQQLQTNPPPDLLSGWLAFVYIANTDQTSETPIEERIMEWRRLYPTHPASKLVDALVQRYYETAEYPGKISILLPLSGSYRHAANSLMHGMMAGFYQLPETKRPLIRIYDSEQYSLDQLLSQFATDGTEWIIGPLKRDNVDSIMIRDDINIPVLTLNYSDIPTTAGERYQFGLLPEDEATQSAERIAIDGHYRVLLFISDNSRGNRVANAFNERFAQLGGQIIANYGIPDNARDYSNLIKSAMHIDESQRRKKILTGILGENVEFEPRRRQDVDAFFISTTPTQTRILRPQLKFHRSGDVPVYATSSIYSGEPSPGDDRDLNDVMFCDIPWALPSENPVLRSAVETFSNDWPELVAYKRFYALGLDAFQVLPYLGRLNESSNETFTGTTGTLSMKPGGAIHRKLHWAIFRNGTPQVLEQDFTVQ